MPSQPARPGQGPLPSLALPVPATALRHQFQLGLGARLLSGVGGWCTGRPIASRRGEAISARDRHVTVFATSAASGVRTLARPPGFRSASRNKDIGRHPGPAGCPNRTLFSPHFPGSAATRDGGDRNEKENRDCGLGAIAGFFAGDRTGTRRRCRARSAVGRRGAWTDRRRRRRGRGLHRRTIDFSFMARQTIKRGSPRTTARPASGSRIRRRQPACSEKPSPSANGSTSAGGISQNRVQRPAGSGARVKCATRNSRSIISPCPHKWRRRKNSEKSCSEMSGRFGTFF
jgi:hypothetical protein